MYRSAQYNGGDFAERERDACGIGAVVSIKGAATHETVDNALKIVERLEHRAGKDGNGETGDGVGIMLCIPHAFFARAAESLGIRLPSGGDYGVGMFFLPTDRRTRESAMRLFEVVLKKEGLQCLGWREVPTRPETLGARARDCMPRISQCFVARPSDASRGLEFDRRLYVARRVFEHSRSDCYIASLSSRTIVYKGMFLVGQLRKFYPDLSESDTMSAMALVHSRFSTNTFPSWERAHPNRIILHNGEINTIRGNVDRMLSREETMRSGVMSDMDKVLPVVDASGSDSAQLDNTLEFLMMNGVPLPLAVMMTIPEPWGGDPSMPRARRDLYRYYATMMEPWDGPAAILFSDGDVFGAVLDRNGLRPARYIVTDDDYLVLSSEVGVLDIAPEHIVKKSRLEPGRMLLVDTVSKRLIGDDELKSGYAARKPYGEWLDRGLVSLADLKIPNARVPSHEQAERDRLYKNFGYSYEDIASAILPMARDGAEPTAAMGADTPLAILDSEPRPLFDYFKQQFAQVTNPPIDAIREELVTDTTVYVGRDGNLLEETPENCEVLRIRNPILTGVDMLKIRAIKRKNLSSRTVSLLYYKNTPLVSAVDNMFVAVDRAWREGATIVILSDMGVDENHVAIPSLLAVSALEQYLIRTKKRTAVSVIVESAEPRDTHQFAMLLGYGARAVYPYLAHECVAELVEKGLLDKDPHTAIDDYNGAVLHGIVKIASKMGISTIQSYQSAQIFEAVGLDRDFADKYFTNTASKLGGLGIEDVGRTVERMHSRAFDPMGLPTDPTVDSVGMGKLRSGCRCEEHLYSPEVILTLRKAVRDADYELFRSYSSLVNGGSPKTLRAALELAFPEDGGVSIDEVEPASEIVKRFKTGAMSYGSISKEAHECLAVAMNRLGGRSNSGEGGEEPSRLGGEANSAIKQVASGRFGVTSEYLLSAQEIQIKMAQGAKPGEGGHLPGKKVWPHIAHTRLSTPGVSLISPPPHHDIYSIEDLAQLIYDLKCANSRARISVKLASESGVGTIAAGVAKAGAEVVLISGFDGGTGAAPRGSIPNAGLPWEIGLSEAHRTLVESGLRSRVRLETDGKLMTGRDVAVACMLGAEEFGFATAPLIALGCVMMRVCNLDTCPMGIATQDPVLRKNFDGKPEYVENFMLFVAEELRGIMARLGVRKVAELVGRTDLLKRREGVAADLSYLLAPPETGESCRPFDFALERTKDATELMTGFTSPMEDGSGGELTVRVGNTDRAFGTIFGSELTRRFGTSLAPGTYKVRCEGSGGQSFGAFIPKGLEIALEGDANDYFGKGLSGGTLALFPPRERGFGASENVIVGNVALYGATSGEAYICGTAGERFCVRNSGAEAVVEGVGDHGCEYMTGGRAVILGPTGRNFAAGMSGGIAYVLDEGHDLYLRVNKELVTIEPVTEESDADELRSLIERHAALTGSERAKSILARYSEKLPDFKRIVPRDYAKMLRAIAAHESNGTPHAEAELAAFAETTKGASV